MINFDFSSVTPLCENFEVLLTDEIKERLTIYGNMLIERNKSVNLTAITEPDEIVLKHFFDCILFYKNITPDEGASIIDIGTGAGFPGLVLKIIRPDINLTLLDALSKRLTFLKDVLQSTCLSAEILHLRAEDGGRDPALRENFDYAVSRAVAALPTLCEFCIPYVRPGGFFVAMKGEAAASEAENAERAYKTLGCEGPVIYNETLTGEESRAFIVSRKISQTSPKHPRSFAKIKKSAL